ncbi:MAG TPA: hypothetical protein VJS64_09195 [Pyrinomonadaceae bacterium]|nr:hypothetical protein [Pyrinomonadaceae bacterium]
MKLRIKKSKFLALFMTATASAAFALGATDANSERPSAPSTDTVKSLSAEESDSTPFVTTPSAEDQNDNSVALLIIRPSGFEPKELTIPAGKTLVVVRNRTGLDQLSIRLERGGGTRLIDVRLPRYKREWKQVIQLPPDTYVVTETNHPDWECRITVTAN